MEGGQEDRDRESVKKIMYFHIMECWEALKVAEALKEAAIVWLLQGPGFGHQISLFHGCSQG